MLMDLTSYGYYLLLTPQEDRINQIRCHDWLPEQARYHHFATQDCPVCQKSDALFIMYSKRTGTI